MTLLRKKIPNVKHSKATVRWGTPDTSGHDYLQMSRQALGGDFDLDPMSEEVFNKRIRARRFFTEQDDCFTKPWDAERLIINPAGGLVITAWEYLMQELLAGRVRKAIWIGFSVEQLNLLADCAFHPMDFSWLLPRKRIPFIRHDGFIGSPGHANYVVAMGVDHGLFRRSFSGRGKFGYGSRSIGTVVKDLYL